MPMPFQPWRASLLPASFGGASFKVEGGGFQGGRRLVMHEYARQDTPFVEDLGRKGRRWQITGYCIGPNYLADRDALIAACEAEGPATFVHPTFGTQTVHCNVCNPIESREKGGYVAFELVFFEAGKNPDASPTTDTQAQVSSAADSNSSTAASTADQGTAASSNPSSQPVSAIGSDTVATAKANAGSSYPTAAPSNVGSFVPSNSRVG